MRTNRVIEQRLVQLLTQLSYQLQQTGSSLVSGFEDQETLTWLVYQAKPEPGLALSVK